MRCLIALALLVSGCATTAEARPRPKITYKVCNGVLILSTQTCPSPTPVPAPLPPPPPPPGIVQAIADNFDTKGGLTLYTGLYPQSDETVGAFRMFCGAGPIVKDDPIVYAGQPGVSHAHQLFGHDGVNAYSTYESLRTSGGTTCGASATPINRSGYWLPAMLDGAGHYVKPDYFKVYYKRLPASSPRCSRANVSSQPLGDCVDIPTSLKMLAGTNMATMVNAGVDGLLTAYWSCEGPTGLGSKSRTLAEVIPNCPINQGNQLKALIDFPECWDGKNIDSVDHRSHMAFTSPYPTAPYEQHCPDTHPYAIPRLAIQAYYSIDANFAAGKWHLSSDAEMATRMPGVEAGSTLHMDYWEAWSPIVRQAWLTGCINRHYTCAGGPLGSFVDGLDMIKGADKPAYGWVNPNRLIPVL